MFPVVAHQVISAATACGACLDQNVLTKLPFVGWWLALFIVWSLLIGPFVFSWNKVAGATDLRHPARLFLWFLGLAFAGLFLLQGSVVGPFVLLVPFWVAALVHGRHRMVPSGWRNFCLIVLTLVVVTVPASYLLRAPAPTGSRHAEQAMPVRAPVPTRTSPATPGATAAGAPQPPAPTATSP